MVSNLSNNKIKIAIVGGDRRYLYLSESLTNMGYEVCHLFVPHTDGQAKAESYKELLPHCGGVILPMPVSRDGIRLNTPLWAEDILMTDCFKYIAKDAVVVGGFVTSYVAAAGNSCGVNIIDLLETEELAVRNALPTAEGAVQIAMEETPYTIFGSNCVITGYGRISRILARMLRGLGANVTVTSRKSDHMAWIVSEGYQSHHTARIAEIAPMGDIFFNTIPSTIFTRDVLARMHTGALVIDLASMPGGTDFDAAKKLGIQTVHALSLPGKVAPKSAAAYIAEVVTHIFDKERNDTL